jgi:hypothetical protein
VGGVSAQVGIGTTTPSNDLDVEGSGAAATAIDINNTTTTGDPKINLQIHGTTIFSIGIDNTDADKLKIGTTAVETSTRLTIDASGNCGIGNTAPSAKLDVDGSAIFNESGAAVNFRVESDNNTGMLFVDGTNDRVGIGLSSPQKALDVYGAASIWSGARYYGSSSYMPAGSLTIGDRTQNFGGGTNEVTYLTGFMMECLDNTEISFHDYGNKVSSFVYYEGGSNRLTFGRNNGWGEIATIALTGNVGIGTTSPSYKLSVNGEPGANGYTAFTNYSDSRLKTNITNLDTGALSKIMQLRPVSFQYNQKYLQLYAGSDLQKVHKGFIAQEIRQVFPEMVSEMKASADSVQYLDLNVSHLQVYLVKALQEQQVIINAQKAEIDAQKAEAMLQKAEIDNQKSEIDALKVNALKVAELENKMNAMLLLLNNKQDLTVKQ